MCCPGETHLRMPLGIAVITAYFLGNRFTKNIYEVLIDTNGTPFLPEMPTEAYSIPAAEVMTPVEEIGVLSFDSTYMDAKRLLRVVNSEVIPVVQSTSSMVIVGALLREDLAKALGRLERYHNLALTPPIQLGLSFSAFESSASREMLNQMQIELREAPAMSPGEQPTSLGTPEASDPFQQTLRFVVFMVSAQYIR